MAFNERRPLLKKRSSLSLPKEEKGNTMRSSILRGETGIS